MRKNKKQSNAKATSCKNNVTNTAKNKKSSRSSKKTNNSIGFEDDSHSFELDEDDSHSFELR